MRPELLGMIVGERIAGEIDAMEQRGADALAGVRKELAELDRNIAVQIAKVAGSVDEAIERLDLPARSEEIRAAVLDACRGLTEEMLRQALEGLAEKADGAGQAVDRALAQNADELDLALRKVEAAIEAARCEAASEARTVMTEMAQHIERRTWQAIQDFDEAALASRITEEIRTRISGPIGERGPGFTFRGLWRSAAGYASGDVVMSASGSLWCAAADVSGVRGEPGESDGWSLMVKRGRAGKAGVGIASLASEGGALVVRLSDGSEATLDFPLYETADAEDVPLRAWCGAWSVDRSYARGDAVALGTALYVAAASSRGVVPSSDPGAWRVVLRPPAAGDAGGGSPIDDFVSRVAKTTMGPNAAIVFAPTNPIAIIDGGDPDRSTIENVRLSGVILDAGTY